MPHCPTRSIRSIASLVVVLVVAACGGLAEWPGSEFRWPGGKVEWQSASKSKDYWAEDKAACRLNATKKLRKEQTRVYRPDTAGEHQAYKELRAMFRKHDDAKREDALFSRCMRAKGYKEVKVD